MWLSLGDETIAKVDKSTTDMAEHEDTWIRKNVHTQEDDQSRVENEILKGILCDDKYNMDVEAISQLLARPLHDKEARLVTWVLGRCPNPQALQKAEDLIGYMSQRQEGAASLLVVLAAENGLSGVDTAGTGHANPFSELLLMIERVLQNPLRAKLPGLDGCAAGKRTPATSDISFWKQQNIVTVSESGELEYETVVASPNLLIVHMLTWNEVINRTLVTAGKRFNNASLDPSKHLTIGMVARQFKSLFPPLVYKSIVKSFSLTKSPSLMELKELQTRFEAANASLISRRLKYFIHETYNRNIQSKLKCN